MKRDVQPGRCVYCGWRCDGVACAQHRDLLALESSTSGNNGDISVEGGDK